jgi:DNA modification methylase
MRPYYEHGNITIYNADCAEILPRLMCCALVLTDPPYGIGQAKGMGGGGFDGFGNRQHRQPRKYEGDWDVKPQPDLLRLAVTAGKHAIVWGGNYFTDVLPQAERWLAWDKQQTMPSYSDVELAWTNLPGVALKMFRFCGAGIFAVEQVRWHPTQKPVALMQWCLCQIAACTGTVLDPFMGSGSTLVAAKLHGNAAIGIEIEEKYCEIAATRLAQEVLPFDEMQNLQTRF